MEIYILLVYAFNGCVTTSAIPGKDKNLLMKSIASNRCLKEMCWHVKQNECHGWRSEKNQVKRWYFISTELEHKASL